MEARRLVRGHKVQDQIRRLMATLDFQGSTGERGDPIQWPKKGPNEGPGKGDGALSPKVQVVRHIIN